MPEFDPVPKHEPEVNAPKEKVASKPKLPRHRARAKAAEPIGRLTMLRSGDLKRQQKRTWLLHGVLQSGKVTIIYGPTTVGKSQLAMAMAGATAFGHSWGGEQFDAGLAVYVMCEDADSLDMRYQAWCIANHEKLAEAQAKAAVSTSITVRLALPDTASASCGGQLPTTCHNDACPVAARYMIIKLAPTKCPCSNCSIACPRPLTTEAMAELASDQSVNGLVRHLGDNRQPATRQIKSVTCHCSDDRIGQG